MRNIKLIIEYDGTNYSGWQIQKNGPSIQEELQKVLRTITGEECNVNGSGRTDAGVHAIGQVANFRTSSRMPADRFAYALNSMLPKDITIKASIEAEADFHARFSAIGKCYRYKIFNSRFPSALLRNYAYYINYCDKLDMNRLRSAADCFTGTHDFSGFMSTGSSVEDTVRTIYKIDVEKNEALIEICFEGNGFLYNMVRIIVGTLIYTGIGKIAVPEIPDIIRSKDRSRAGITAPAHGLYLEKVLY